MYQAAYNKYVIIKSVDGCNYEGTLVDTSDHYFVLKNQDGKVQIFPLATIVFMQIDPE